MSNAIDLANWGGERHPHTLPEDWKEVFQVCLQVEEIRLLAYKVYREFSGESQENTEKYNTETINPERQYVSIDTYSYGQHISLREFINLAADHGINLYRWPEDRIYTDLICRISDIVLQKKNLATTLNEMGWQNATSPLFKEEQEKLLKSCSDQVFEIISWFPKTKNILAQWSAAIITHNRNEDSLDSPYPSRGWNTLQQTPELNHKPYESRLRELWIFSPELIQRLRESLTARTTEAVWKELEESWELPRI